MKVICPKCSGDISGKDVNVAADVAYCSKCCEAFSLSGIVASEFDMAEQAGDAALLHQDPPDGMEVYQEGSVILILARHYRLPVLFLIPFTCVWSGISLGGIYGSQIFKGQFDLVSSIFGLPFLCGTLFLLYLVASMLICRSMLIIDDNGVTLGKIWFRKPDIPGSAMMSEFELDGEGGMPRRSWGKFWKWGTFRNVHFEILNNERNRLNVRPDTLVIPAMPRKRQSYILAVLREKARRKNVRLEII